MKIDTSHGRTVQVAMFAQAHTNFIASGQPSSSNTGPVCEFVDEIDPEWKCWQQGSDIDLAWVTSSPPAGPEVYSINRGIVQGISPLTRIGTKIRIKMMEFRGTWYMDRNNFNAGPTNAPMEAIPNTIMCRCLFVLDARPTEGVDLADILLDPYEADTLLAFTDSSRFQLMEDIGGHMTASGINWCPASWFGGVEYFSCTYGCVQFYMRQMCDIPVSYPEGTDPGSGVPLSNEIFFIPSSSQISNTSPINPWFWTQSRVWFTDE